MSTVPYPYLLFAIVYSLFAILLGAPVWYGNRPFDKAIEEVYKLELDFVEFSLDYPLPESMDDPEREWLKRVLDEHDLKIGFHSPLDTAVAHPRDEIADASKQILRRCIAFSAEFLPRSLYYNFHLHPGVPTYKLEDVRNQINIKSLKRCEEMTRMAAESGITACVENDLVPFEWSDLIPEALSLLSPRLYFTFDVGHAIMAEVPRGGEKKKEGFYREYLEQWIEKCGDKILVVHLHDCSFTENVKQDHLAIGEGELDFNYVFDLLRSTSCKYLLIETFWKNTEKKKVDYEELKRSVELCRSYL
ncbi:MAG: sugar phosphate isomerase/epimerase [Methanophagales archaeon]|nr:sugar phosphate isomerase/epimerase [Methanophagales archaeon]